MTNQEPPKFNIEVGTGLIYFFLYPILTAMLIHDTMGAGHEFITIGPGMAFALLMERFVIHFAVFLEGDEGYKPSAFSVIIDALCICTYISMIIGNTPLEIGGGFLLMVLFLRIVHTLKIFFTIVNSYNR